MIPTIDAVVIDEVSRRSNGLRPNAFALIDINVICHDRDEAGYFTFFQVNDQVEVDELFEVEIAWKKAATVGVFAYYAGGFPVEFEVYSIVGSVPVEDQLEYDALSVTYITRANLLKA